MNELQPEVKTRNIWSNLKGWYRTIMTIFQDYQAISWLVGLVLVGGISDVLFFGLRISKWLQEPLIQKMLPITPILILSILVVPVLSFHLGFYIQNYHWKKKRYFFTTAGPFKWKTNITTRKTSNKPYCRKHELGMLPSKDGSWCPAHPCKVGKNISSATKGLFLLIATQKAEAKLDKHLKVNIFIKLKSWWRFRKKIKELDE